MSEALMTETPRVRFAPSPTGYLHIGGARTVLFNWLHARKNNGTFVLRVEDTDQARSTDESVQNILEAMKWLGMDWDEGPDVGGEYGPYTQTERLKTYKELADRLVEEGKAYRCYATKEELEALRNQLPPDKRARFVYPHIWRDKTERDWIPNQPYVIRFKTPLEGETTFRDKVFGDISVPHTQLQDFIIMRSDGIPLYNFGAVVDDVLMKITLVARGSDHIVNTPQQVLLYQALDYPIPEFAHLPVILGPAGKKMSKRDGEKYGIPVSVMNYKDMGFSPLGLINYLVRFGWSHGDQELFTLEELTQLFSFDSVSSADGKFDMKKLQAIGQKIIRDDTYTSHQEYVERLRPFMATQGLECSDQAYLEQAIHLARSRASTFVECAEGLRYFLSDDFEYDPKAKTKLLTPDSGAVLQEYIEVIKNIDPFDAKTLEAATSEWLSAKNMHIKHLGQPIRVALTGQKSTPGFYDIMEILGKDRSLSRIQKGITLANTGSDL